MKKHKCPPGFEPVDHSTIDSIVSRMHVSASPLTVARTIRKSLKWETTPPAHRRYAIAAAIQAHARNVWEYRYMMGSVPRPYADFQPRYFFNRTTQQTIIL